MPRSIDRFEVNIKATPIEAARASVVTAAPSGVVRLWPCLLVLPLGLAAGMVWARLDAVALPPAIDPAPEAVVVPSPFADIEPAAGEVPVEYWFSRLWRIMTWHNPPSPQPWPVVLQRAGDGEFYGELWIEGQPVTAQIVVARPYSTIRRSDLPATADPEATIWRGDDLRLEHLPLGDVFFLVDGGPEAMTIVGHDALHGHLIADEQRASLYLRPLVR